MLRAASGAGRYYWQQPSCALPCCAYGQAPGRCFQHCLALVLIPRTHAEHCHVGERVELLLQGTGDAATVRFQIRSGATGELYFTVSTALSLMNAAVVAEIVALPAARPTAIP
jgi:hypothetical protein